MNNSDTKDRQLGDYLAGKSPISAHYSQLDVEEPKAEIDSHILQKARLEVRRKRHRQRWTLPASIAAAVLIGVVTWWWQQYPTSMPNNETESAAPTPNKTLPQQIDRSLHNNPVADAWLTRILKLQQAGHSRQAAAEFKKFRQAYPLYSIDQKRFGALQQYDQSN